LTTHIHPIQSPGHHSETTGLQNHLKTATATKGKKESGNLPSYYYMMICVRLQMKLKLPKQRKQL